jgi:oligosaccharide repeat unit polymerase
MMFARPGRFGFWSKMAVVIGLILTVLQGVSTGTRFVMMGYVSAFVTVYILSLPGLNFAKLLRIVVPASALVLAITVLLLQFRNPGMSRSVADLSTGETEVDTSNFEVDRNLSVIAKIVSLVPHTYPYIGSEIYLVSLVRPIPRALWPGKPEGVSVSPATVIGEEQATIASTFIGEAYLSRGIVTVLITGLVFGWLMAIWNRVGARLTCNGSILVYTSGVFAFVLTMRSITEFFAILMPTLAAIILARIYGEKTLEEEPAVVMGTGASTAGARMARPNRRRLRPLRVRARRPKFRMQNSEVGDQKSV